MAYSVTAYSGTKSASLGSACEEVDSYLTGSALTGTIHGIGIIPIGDGKYFQPWIIHQ